MRAATALLGDASRLVFDYLAPRTITRRRRLPSPASTAGRKCRRSRRQPCDLSHVTAVFDDLAINETTIPAYTINGLRGPSFI
jgi:hypothetical protein